MLSHINPSEDEKEDLPSGVRTVNSWSAVSILIYSEITMQNDLITLMIL